MDFRLKVFATAAKTLNYSRTAEMLGISQPAVTHHIKQLEEKYKVRLFSRQGNSFALTYCGELLLKKTLEILALYKDMEQEGALLSNVTEGTFCIGMPRAIYWGIFPDFAADWCRLSPNSNISHNILNLGQIAKAVKENQVSVGIRAGATEQDIDYFFTDTLVCVTPATGKQVQYMDIAETRLVKYQGDEETSAEIAARLSAAGVNPQNIQLATTMKDPVSAIKFIMEYGNGQADAALPVVAFVWKSQVNEPLKKGKLRIVSITEMEDIPPARRCYATIQNSENTLPGFGAFARGWAKRKGLL